MPNQLSIPLKKTWDIDIKSAVYTYLRDQIAISPDAFKWDVTQWKSLRKEVSGGLLHANQILATMKYHAQLLSILAKFPINIQLEIPYAPAFSPHDLPVKLNNLAFERAALLFNLAALYSQLAAAEDRSSREGVRHASAYYQSSAGTFSFLISSAIPKLSFTPSDEDVPWDLTEPFVKSLEWLMLAQAQECVWQRAMLDNYKNGLIAKLAASVASLYGSSLDTIRHASLPILDKFPAGWISYLETKRHHFYAAAQLRKSMDEFESNRYGIELGRLAQAEIDAKKANDSARLSGVAPAVFQDAKSLLETVRKIYLGAERDNDLIYHQDVPSSSALDAIHEACMVKSMVPPGLTDPRTIIGGENIIFGNLLGWGVQEAINIYENNKNNLIKEKIVDVARDLDDQNNETLRSLNLPSSLEALERPVGLPPSLLKKAEEVRTEEGPTRIETSIEDVQKLAQHNMSILDEAMDILDSEASEDEAARKDSSIQRPPSHEANQELVSKEQEYRATLEKAASSDEHVRRKWDEWEINIRELAWDEHKLTDSVPSSTIRAPHNSSSNSSQSHTHARALRVLLESIDEVKSSRSQIVERAQRVADADSIKPRILEAAAGFERLVEIEPAMFEEIMDEEIAKYEKFLESINESDSKQDEILSDVRIRNELFLQSRRDDPSVKEREHALQSLDLAYQKYREITRNLDEGLKFYNDFAEILTNFKESCKGWSIRRKQEIRELSRALNAASLADGARPPKHPSQSRPPPAKNIPSPPSLHSTDWVTMALPPAPRRA